MSSIGIELHSWPAALIELTLTNGTSVTSNQYTQLDVDIACMVAEDSLLQVLDMLPHRLGRTCRHQCTCPCRYLHRPSAMQFQGDHSAIHWPPHLLSFSCIE